jgi:hypothetical protein
MDPSACAYGVADAVQWPGGMAQPYVETICGYTSLPCRHFGNNNETLNRNPHSGPPLGPST